MSGSIIKKDGHARGDGSPGPTDDEPAWDAFTWEAARDALDGLAGGGLNIAHEAVDRHVMAGRGGRVALRCLGRDGAARDITYAALMDRTNRFANVLQALGVDRGETVVSILGRAPALYVTALGAMKHGSGYCPLFSAFGPEPIQARMAIGKARVLVTTEPIYRTKVAPQRDRLPDLRHVLIVGAANDLPQGDGVYAFDRLLDEADGRYDTARTGPENRALLHFTSGTTGRPKGAIHVHEAVVAHRATAQYALDLRPDDVFWCTADPGWVTGTSYGVIAPLALGATVVVDAADFDLERWYRILRDEKVNVWYTAPTAIRMLMRLGADLRPGRDLPALRHMASVGEPLNPEAVLWSVEAFGRPFHDTWWQTETGAIMVSNAAALDIKPGSMGKPVPGIEAAAARRGDDGHVGFVEAAGEPGELVLRAGWPSMFRGYLDEPERYRACFQDGWYFSGDLVTRDADGYFWFVGRADDIIKTSGHMVGPFEVENVLMEHPAVAEAGVIGKPDAMAMEVVKAFVSLKPGHAATDDLRRDLMAHARRRLGAAIAPKEIAFTDTLPKTRSGKITRRLLKARELGLDEGDVSTLE